MKKIILDCDPGHDDMIAITLALSVKNIKVLGITTVAGNQTLEKTLKNALKTLTLLKKTDIPVSGGFYRPLIRNLSIAEEIHGSTGLDGSDLPEPDIQPTGRHAVDFITDTITNNCRELSKQKGGKLFIVATGPLTNIAVSLIKAPEIKECIERIVLMGGGIHDSNITPAAEFNIAVDPEAAKIVFESGLPITMIPLDVTNRCIFTLKDIKKIARLKGPVSGVISDLLLFFARKNMELYNLEGAPLHDPLTIAYLIDNSVIDVKPYHVDIETHGEYTSGETVVDIYGVTGKKPNVDVAVDVNINKYKDMIFQAIDYHDKRLS